MYFSSQELCGVRGTSGDDLGMSDRAVLIIESQIDNFGSPPYAMIHLEIESKILIFH